jgi:acyl transferase domain-containing protein/acyl carrier protein
LSDAINPQDTLTQLKRALAAIKELRAKLEAVEQSRYEPIAVVGMGCRLPAGTDSPAAFWQVLANGLDAISEVPANRWSMDALYDADVAAPGKMNTRWGAFLEHVDQFDAAFFGISPLEATYMDPQQRLLLEVAYEALEEAGQTLEQVAGSQTGVFVGVHSYSNDYSLMQMDDLGHITPETATGTAHSIVANRLSYVLDLHGPSMAVDTACSSALVAIHLACQSLRNQECDMALSGGVNMMLSPEATVAFSKLQMMSLDGYCKTFDARADGFVRGEGCGLVVLKRLSDAQRDGDSILAIIRGSAVNQDGRTNGLTAPNSESQEAVIKLALRNSHIDPALITFVETHGTGTALGDPIEVEALANTIGRAGKEPCYLGSAKANVGHLEGAAGIVGLLKVILSLQHGSIPPQPHFQRLNPHINLETTRFAIPTRLQPWPAQAGLRYAALSSFGFGGTNSHIILSSAPVQNRDSEADAALSSQPLLLPISARNAESLRNLARRYQDFLAETQSSLADICYSTSVHRSHLEHRLALVGTSRKEFVDQLETFSQTGMPDAGLAHEQQHGIVFVFSGQGSQWVGMGQELLANEPLFRTIVEQIDVLLRHEGADWSLLHELAAGVGQSRLEETQIAQPAIFALQVALAGLWRAWGIVPDAVIGHSVGEVAAAHIAGVLTLSEAVRLVFHRGRVMQKATGLGKMAVIGLSKAKTEELLQGYGGQLSIAALNSPTSTVVAGDSNALADLLDVIQEQGYFGRMLTVDYAFHTPQMEPLQRELTNLIAGLTPKVSTIPIYSTVNGSRGGSADFDAKYWGRNVREPVQFASALVAAKADGYDTYLEIAPHSVLHVPIAQCLDSSGDVLNCASLQRGEGERASLLRALSALHCWGYPVTWRALYPRSSHFVRLPSYPWQHKSFWLPTRSSSPSQARLLAPAAKSVSSQQPLHPLLHYRGSGPLTTFGAEWNKTSAPKVIKHQLQNRVILSAAAIVEMIFAAAKSALPGTAKGSLTASDIRLQSPLLLPENSDLILQMVVIPDSIDAQGATSTACQLYSLDSMDTSDAWQFHASGQVSHASTPPTRIEFNPIQARNQVQDVAGYRAQLEQGLNFAADLPGILKLWQSQDEALARVQPSQSISDNRRTSNESSLAHLAFIDAGIQLLLACATSSEVDEAERAGYLMTGIKQWTIHQQSPAPEWLHVVLRTHMHATVEGDLRLLDAEGNTLVELAGITFKRFAARDSWLSASQQLLYDLVWQQQEQPDGPLSLGGVGRWLIFADHAGLGHQLAAQLVQMGQSASLIIPDTYFGPLSDGGYQLNTARPEEYLKLVQEVSRQEGPPLRGVLYLWCLDEDALPESLVDLEQSQKTVCTHALYLVQALAQVMQSEDRGQNRADLPKLWFVTQRSQVVGASLSAGSSDALSLVSAPLWGLGKVVSLEHPEIWGGMIDLDLKPASAAASDVIQTIASSGDEDQIAYRQGQRYVARLLNCLPSREGKQSVEIKSDGTYLLTGGLGALGLEVAKWLVSRGAQHLVLTSRTGLPERAHWDGDDLDTTTRSRIASVRSLETGGATVDVVAVDVANLEQMNSLFARLAQQDRPLRGVIHAAGTLSIRPLLDLNETELNAILRPKTLGGWLLHQCTQALPLDFFVMFSSGAAIWGSAGMGHYAAANHFVDALAHYRRSVGLPALSINWGWWQDGGMTTPEIAQSFAASGIRAIATEQALAIMEQLLADNIVQKSVAAIDWRIFKPLYETKRRRPLLAEITIPAEEPVDHETPKLFDLLVEAEPVQRFELLLSHVRSEAASILGYQEATLLDLNKGFFKMGMNSLMTVQLRVRLEKSLDCTLPATVGFEYPTIQSLTSYLANDVLGHRIAASNGSTNGALANGEQTKSISQASTGAQILPSLDLESLASEDLLALFDEELAAANAFVERNSK